MKLEQSFEVDAPLERVWEALVDVERVAPCLPGAAVTGRNEDGTYNGTFTIKIGPTTASYTGKLEMQNVDEPSHSATLHAHGSDLRGQGGATATIVSTLSGAGGHTRVDVVTDYHITGRLARFGRGGMIEDISERLLREFAGRLQSSLVGVGASEAPTAVHHIEGMGEASGVGVAGEAAPAAPGEVPPPTEVAAAAPKLGAPEPGGSSEPPISPPPPPTPGVEASPPASPAGPVEQGPPPTPADQVSPPAPPAPASASPAAPPPTPPPGPVEQGPPPPTEQVSPPAPPARAPASPAAPPPPTAAPPPPPPAPPAAAEQAQPAAPPPPSQAAPPASEPQDAGSLTGSTLVDRVKRNPKPVIAVAGGLLLARLLRRRR